MKESYGTLSETINALKKEGYTKDFNIHHEHLVCHQEDRILSPDDFEIDKVYRFEGESNPDDQSILYAISSPTFGTKGFFGKWLWDFFRRNIHTLIIKLNTHQIKMQ